MATPTYAQLLQALNSADRAGNVDDAMELANLIRELYPEGNVEDAVTPQSVINEAMVIDEGLGNVDVTMEQPLANNGVIREPTAAENITQQTRPQQQVLATLEPGQLVVQNANGVTEYVDQINRIVSNNEEVVAAAMALSQGQDTEHPAEVYARVQAKLNFQGEGGVQNYLTGLSGNVVEGSLGVGSYRDEGLGAVNDGVNWLYQQANRSMPYTQNTFEDGDMSSNNNLLMTGDEIAAKSKALDANFDLAYPKSSIAANVAGGLVTGYLGGSTKAAQKLYKWINGLSRTWKALALTGTGAAIGGAEGTLYGYGAGEDGGRVEEAMNQGIMGAGLGAGANLAIMPLSWAFSRIANGLKDKSTEAIASLFVISKEAAQIIKESIKDSGATLEDVVKNLNLGGTSTKTGSMVADSDVATQVLLDAVAASGGGTSAQVSKALQARMGESFRMIDNSMDKNIADLPYMDKPNQNIKQDPQELAENAAKASAPARSKAYNKAYANKIDYLTDEGKAVQQALNDIDEDVLTQILTNINKSIKKSGGDATELAFNRSVKANGDEILTLVDVPSMKQLDYIKRELSDIAYNSPGVPAAGQLLPTLSREAKDALDLRYTLSNALKNANPDYAKAVKLGQDKITRENALEQGYKMLDEAYSPQMVTRLLRDAGDAEKEMARMGIRAHLERVIGRMKPTPSRMPDSKELDEIFRVLSSRDNRNILQQVLSPNAYKKMVKDLDKAEVAIKLRISVAENSKTAIRANVGRNIEDVSNEAASIRQTLAEGRGIEATRKIIQRINETDAITAKMKKIIMKDLANAMMGQRGTNAIAQMKAVYKAIQKGDQTMADIEYLANFMYSGINLQFITGAATKGREIRDTYNKEPTYIINQTEALAQ
tara:strand:- start:1088 stop:3742 length:2655 start_codon:yes stop_codon:yes gene_type:complete